MPEPRETKKVRGVFERPTGSGVWWIQYFASGKRHRERVGSRGNAIRLREKRKTQLLLDEKLPELSRRAVTVGELIDDTIAYANEHNASARDYLSKGELLRQVFGSRPAKDLQIGDVEAWLRRRDVAPATCNRYRAFLSLCFREGMRLGKVQSNPIRQMHQRREPAGRKRYLTPAEYTKVYAAIAKEDSQRAAAFSVSVHTGMRLSEQFRLRWKHVDFERGEINLVNPRSKETRTKSGEDRTVPMSSLVREHLLSLQHTECLSSDLVFARPRKGAGQVQPRWFSELLQSEAIGIEDYTWHNNRHTFCSWLAIAGTPLRTIQELAGHKTISITARYAHLSPDHKLAAIEQLVHSGKKKVLPFATATKTA